MGVCSSIIELVHEREPRARTSNRVWKQQTLVLVLTTYRISFMTANGMRNEQTHFLAWKIYELSKQHRALR